MNFSDLFLEFADSSLQIGQAIQGGVGFEPLAIFYRRIAGVQAGGRHVVGDAAFGGDDSAVANGEVASGANLPGENATIANFCSACQANLAAEHGVSSDLRSMSN